MRNYQEDGSGAYATSTCVRGAHIYAVVVSASDLEVVCWCENRAEARSIADRLNARAARTPRRLVIPQMRRRAG